MTTDEPATHPMSFFYRDEPMQVWCLVDHIHTDLVVVFARRRDCWFRLTSHYREQLAADPEFRTVFLDMLDTGLTRTEARLAHQIAQRSVLN